MMNWEFLTQLVIFATTIAGLIGMVLKYYFNKTAQQEAAKIKAREKIKQLEGQLADVMMTQIKGEIEDLKVALQDLRDSNEDMMIQYEKLVSRMENNNLKVDLISEEFKEFARKLEKMKENFGRVIDLDKRR